MERCETRTMYCLDTVFLEKREISTEERVNSRNSRNNASLGDASREMERKKDKKKKKKQAAHTRKRTTNRF